MRLVFATKDLKLAGRSFEDFPLLIGSDGLPVEPAQSFLWHVLVESGEALSVSTWEAYGRRLFDYFAFLEVNGLSWNEGAVAPGRRVAIGCYPGLIGTSEFAHPVRHAADVSDTLELNEYLLRSNLPDAHQRVRAMFQ